MTARGVEVETDDSELAETEVDRLDKLMGKDRTEGLAEYDWIHYENGARNTNWKVQC